MNLSHIPNSEIARLYSAVADKPVTRFSDRSVGLRRLEAILTERRYRIVEDEVGLSVTPLDEVRECDAPDAIAEAPVEHQEIAEAAAVIEEPKDNGMAAYVEITRTVEQQPGKRVMGTASTPTMKSVALPASEASGWWPKVGSKNEQMLAMVLAEGGASEADICAAIGWKACTVTLKRACSKAGLTLALVKVAGQRSRYVASRPQA